MYKIRLMRREDIDQVVEIDKEAFPTQWPPTNYRNELQNRLARYIVVYIENELAEVKPQPKQGFFTRIRRFFGDNRKSIETREDFIVGFAGCWIMADETHITEIAVRGPYRRQGIAQLLMINLIEMGIEQKANLTTLEVRATNTGAQQLYKKMGFEKVGVRKAYYTDNHEDALIMTNSNIKSSEFQLKVSQIKQALMKRWNLSEFPVIEDTRVRA